MRLIADVLDGMRARIDADEQALHDYWPDGSMGRAWADLGVALRRLGVEVFAATRIPQVMEWLSRRIARR